MKYWVEKLINCICKLDQSGKNILQKWIKVALYPGPDADSLLRWLENESQGLDVLDHLLVLACQPLLPHTMRMRCCEPLLLPSPSDYLQDLLS